jgi:hypothetical protein
VQAETYETIGATAVAFVDGNTNLRSLERVSQREARDAAAHDDHFKLPMVHRVLNLLREAAAAEGMPVVCGFL